MESKTPTTTNEGPQVRLNLGLDDKPKVGDTRPSPDVQMMERLRMREALECYNNSTLQVVLDYALRIGRAGSFNIDTLSDTIAHDLHYTKKDPKWDKRRHAVNWAVAALARTPGIPIVRVGGAHSGTYRLVDPATEDMAAIKAAQAVRRTTKVQVQMPQEPDNERISRELDDKLKEQEQEQSEWQPLPPIGNKLDVLHQQGNVALVCTETGKLYRAVLGELKL